MKRKTVVFISLLLAVLLALAGCGSEISSIIEKDPLLGGDGIDVIDAGNIASDRKDYTEDGQEIITAENTEAIVYLIIPSEEGYTKDEKDIIVQAAADDGYTLVVRNYGREVKLESDYFDEAINIGASLIVCDNWDYDVTAEACTRASDAGVPVMLLDLGLSIQGNADYQIVTDYYSDVASIADEYVSHCAGTSKYIAVFDSNNDIKAVLDSKLSKCEGIEALASDICNGEEKTVSYDTIWNLMSSNSEADTIFCGSSVQALQALEAMKDLGVSMEVYCLCGDDDRIINYVQQGVIYATIMKPAEEIAGKAAQTIKSFLEEKTMPSGGLLYVKGTVITYIPQSISAEGLEDDSQDQTDASEEYDEGSEDDYDDSEEYYDEDYDEEYDDYDEDYDEEYE